MRSLLLLATGVSALVLISSSAHALVTRAWVSGHGTDSAGCGAPAAPCRSFQYAHDNIIAPGGEIDVLDSAGFGAIVITKAISIVNEGVGTAGVQAAPGGIGVLISAGPNDAINLRGLTVEGTGVGQTGVSFVAGKSLTLANCTVRNFVGSGIVLAPTSAASFVVSNCVAADNGQHGVFVHPSGGAFNVSALFNRVEVYNNGQMGIDVDGSQIAGSIHSKAVDSSAARNGAAGYYALGHPSSFNVRLDVFRSNASSNVNGILGDANVFMHVSQSNLEGNTGANWAATGSGQVSSYGDNYTANQAPPGTLLTRE